MTEAADPNEGGAPAPGPAKRSRRRRRRPQGERPAPNGAAGATPADVQGPGTESAPAGSGASTTSAAGSKRRRRTRRRRSGAADGAGRSAGASAAPPKLRSVPDPSSAVSPAAKALSDSLQAAILTHTSGAVLARGRGYVKRNRVGELHVGAGRIRRVLGSAGERYRVEIAAPQRPAPPVVTKIRWSCDCPYAIEHRRGTCKHVVAVTLVASKRIERTPSVLRRWLGQPAPDAVEADPAELVALADRLRDAFTAEPVSAGDVLARAVAIAPPPFSIPAR